MLRNTGVNTARVLDISSGSTGSAIIFNVQSGAFQVQGNGRVGIGRGSTGNDLEVEGTASKTTSGSWAANSDRRIKQDIETIEGPLETLDKVRLVSFRYTNEYRAAHPSIDDHRYLNIIAQEFAEVFPNYVKSSGEKLHDSDKEILQVDTYPLTIYAAAAIQELHGIVKDRDGRILALEARLGELESAMGTSSPSSHASTLGVATPALALLGLVGVMALVRSRKGGIR